MKSTPRPPFGWNFISKFHWFPSFLRSSFRSSFYHWPCFYPLIQRVQSVQNAAAWLIFRIRRSEHITPAIISLHWLRVPEHISFKLAVMTYRSIHGTSPSYLQSCFTSVDDMTSRRRLRSSTSHRLDVPPVRLSTVGRRAFPVSCATVWNDVPLHVGSAPSLAVFREWLETFLFSSSYQDTCYYHHSSLRSGHLWSLQ